MEKWSFIGLVSWLSKRIVRAFRTRSTDSPSIQDKVYGQSEHSGQSLRTVRVFRTKSADSPSFKDKVYRQSEHSGQSLRTVRALRTKSTDSPSIKDKVYGQGRGCRGSADIPPYYAKQKFEEQN